MKHIFKKTLSFILCFTFLFSITISSTAFASENNNIPNLPENSIILENNDTIVKVMVESENGNCIATLNRETNKITVETIENYDGKDVTKVYDAELTSFEENNIDGKLIDKETGETCKIGKSEGGRQKRFVWLLPLLPEVAAALEALATTATLFTAAGVGWATGTAIKTHIKKQPPEINYFAAVRNSISSRIAIGPPITFQIAKSTIEAKGDVFCRTQGDAFLLTSQCGGAIRKAEIDAGKKPPEYYWHYHPGVSPYSHIWYLIPNPR